jgi:hypothetical protein
LIRIKTKLAEKKKIRCPKLEMKRIIIRQIYGREGKLWATGAATVFIVVKRIMTVLM